MILLILNREPQQIDVTGLVRWRIQFNPGIAAWLPDHPIRSYQHIRRNRQTDLLRGLQIDDEFKLHRLLDWKVCGLSAFEDLVNISGRRRSKSGRLGP